jgi:triosephosphate isomerase
VKRPIIASNWKLYKDRDQAIDFLEQLTAEVEADDLNSHFLFFPPAIHLNLFDDGEYASDFTGEFNFGPQNVYHQKEGAFTGENSVIAAKSYGAKYALIGHSERRQLFGETSETCAKKIAVCLEEQLIPVYCIGETLAEREAGATLKILDQQLSQGIGSLKLAPSKMIIAYEPVWAIGTGKVATSVQAGEAHDFIRDWLTKKFSAEIAKSIFLLYGGSVKPENSKELASQKNIDGFLIGSASLKVESLIGIFNGAN